MEQWIAKGLHGELDYLERNRDKRYDPRELVPGATAIVIALMNYHTTGRDYHRPVKSALYKLAAALNVSTFRVFCDSAPFLERAWAVESGLGFIGLNRQLIHPTLGSFIHPGELVLTDPVKFDLPLRNIEASCGDCRLCVIACPGHALGGQEWDATKCVAYTTHWCLACQTICPFNKNIHI